MIGAVRMIDSVIPICFSCQGKCFFILCAAQFRAHIKHQLGRKKGREEFVFKSDMGEWHWNMYNTIYETNCQSRFEAWYRMLGAGALGWPRGMVQGGRWEGSSGWGTRVHLWRIHVMYGKTNTMKKKKSNMKKKKCFGNYKSHAYTRAQYYYYCFH